MINESEKVVVVVEVETVSEPLLTAAQARKLAVAERRKEADKVFSAILEYIRQHAEGGNLSCLYKCTCHFGADTRPEVSRRLESLGYKVDDSYSSGYSMWSITW